MGWFPVLPPVPSAPRKSYVLFSLLIAVSACSFPCRFRASTNCHSKRKSIASAGNDVFALQNSPGVLYIPTEAAHDTFKSSTSSLHRYTPRGFFNFRRTCSLAGRAKRNGPRRHHYRHVRNQQTCARGLLLARRPLGRKARPHDRRTAMDGSEERHDAGLLPPHRLRKNHRHRAFHHSRNVQRHRVLLPPFFSGVKTLGRKGSLSSESHEMGKRHFPF